MLPFWLQHMEFGCTRVADIRDVQENNYVLQSGQGVTQLVTKVLFDTIDTIILNPGRIDKLVVILDAEGLEVEERKQQISQKISEHYQTEEIKFDIVTLVCNHCFETWLLGCCGLYPLEVVDEKSDFYPYYVFYDTEENDPEYMGVPEDSDDTIAKYHFHYLHELLRHKKLRYSKNKPQAVAEENYFKGIVKRIEATGHLKTFDTFYNFFLEEKDKREQSYIIPDGGKQKCQLKE